MRRFVILAILCIVTLTISGCTFEPAAPENAGQQLEAFTWTESEKGKVSIVFSDGRFELSDPSSDTVISGWYEADDSEITVYADDGCIVILPYGFDADDLYISYCEKQLSFTKKPL